MHDNETIGVSAPAKWKRPLALRRRRHPRTGEFSRTPRTSSGGSSSGPRIAGVFPSRPTLARMVIASGMDHSEARYRRIALARRSTRRDDSTVRISRRSLRARGSCFSARWRMADTAQTLSLTRKVAAADLPDGQKLVRGL